MFKRWTSKSKHSVDMSFLNHEEVDAILDVLDRDQQVRRMNAERLKEVKKTNPSELWLKGITGQWFEEIRKAKFKDQTDLSKLLKVPPTWSLRKKSQTALTDSKLTQSNNCPQVKNVIKNTKSGIFKGDEGGDPVNRLAASENVEPLLEQDQCSKQKFVHLESPTMFQQLQVQLKPVPVSCVKRKVYMHHDTCKQEHPKVLGQDPETKISNVALDEHEKIMSAKNVSNSELQESTTDEECIKKYTLHNQARLCRKDNKIKIDNLSGNTEEKSLLVGCNNENARHIFQANIVLAVEQQENYCTRVDNGILSNPKSVQSSSINQPKNLLQDHPTINQHDDQPKSNFNWYLSKNKREMQRASLFDLMIESQIVPDISIKQQNYSASSRCESSQRNGSDSASNSESVPFGPMTGPRINVSNKNVLQQNYSDSFLNTSYKTDSHVQLQGNESETILVTSSPALVYTSPPVISTSTNSRCQINALSHNINPKRNTSDSSQVSQLKPSISLSQVYPGCQPRTASRITINIRNRQQYSGSNDTNIVSPIKCNDDCLQQNRDEKERTTLFPNPKTSSLITFNVSKTRMEMSMSRDAEAPLPDGKNDCKQNCRDEGRNTSLLPILVIGSQLSTCDKDKDVVPASASNSIDAALQISGDDYLQKAKSEIGHEPDPRNVASSNNGAVQSQSLKSDNVNLESVINTLQSESEATNAIEMSITQSANHENQMLHNQRSPLNNDRLALDGNSIQNYKPLSIITAPKVLNYKYQLLDNSANSASVRADRTGNEYKSEPNHVPVLSLPDSTKAIPLNIKIGMNNTLQNMQSHTTSSFLTEKPSVDNMQNYKSELTSAPSSGAMTQYPSAVYTYSNVDKSSKNYPDVGNSNVAQQNKYETLPETIKEQNSTATKIHLRPDASFCGGSKYLPKDKSETNSNLPSENSQCDQRILAKSIDNTQRKSQTNFLLGDNITTASKSVGNYPSENNILFSFQGTPTAQQSPTNCLNNMGKLPFHSPARSCTDKNLEDCHSDNYTAVLQPSASSRLQNWETNINDNTKIRGIAKEYKQPGNSKTDIASLPYLFSKQLIMTDCTYKSQDRWLSNTGSTEDRKSLDCLQTLKSEINTPIMPSRVTDQVSPVDALNNKEKQQNYFPNTVNVKIVIEGYTLNDKSETSCVSSSLDLETSQPPFLHTTDTNGCELQNFSFDSYDHIATTGFNKHLEKVNLEICSTGPPIDSCKGSADIVQHLNNRISVNSGLSLDQLVVQESPPPNTDTKKNALPHYSDEGPSDQSNAEHLSERNAAISSPTRMSTLWHTSNNNVSQQPAHPLYNNVEEGAINYLQRNKLKSHTVGQAPGVLTDTRAAASSIEINTDTLQYDTSKATQNDKQYDIFTSKQLQETNCVLSSHSLISKRYPVAIENNNKDYKPFHSQFGGDIRMDRGCKEYLEKGNDELSISDSLTDLQPLNITQNIIGNISVGLDTERNVEYYQPEEQNAISPTALTAQRTPTNFTAGETKAGQTLSPNNNGITFHGRTCNNNTEGHSKAPDLPIDEQFSTNTKFIPKFSTIPNNKYVTTYGSLVNNSGSSAPTVVRGIENLQNHIRPPVPHSVTELNYSTTIQQNKILPLTQFPFNYDTTLGAESIKNIQNYQSEEKCSVSSQDGVAGQQSLSYLFDGQDKLLTCLLKSDETKIDENFQKDEPKINHVISSVICHQPAARVTGITNHSLQQCTKVTDIYKRKRPSTRVKLNLLKRAKCVPSFPEMTGQCQTDNISLYINQEKLKTLPLRDNPNLLPSNKNFNKYQFEKYQAASSIDELNRQCTLTNITQDSKNDTIQTNLPKTDGITLSRGFINNCDLQDRCETKCIPSPLNPAFDQLSYVDLAHSNEHKAPDQVLNFADDAVYPKSPHNRVNKRAILSGDKVIQQISPISTAYSKNKALIHSSIITDTVLSKTVSPVISQQICNSSFRNLSDLFNNDAVSAEITVNKCSQKDAAESNKITTVDSLTGLQSFPTITDINKNIGQNSEKVFDMCDNKIFYEESIHNFLHKTKRAPPQMITGRNQDKPSSHSKLCDEIVMGRKNNDHIQKNKPEANNQFSPCQKSLPYVIKNKQVKPLAHSPVRSSFEINEANIKNAENSQSQNNRGASLHTPYGQKSSTDTTCGKNIEFQNSSPKNEKSLRRIYRKSEHDINLSLPDLIDQEYSTDVTFNKNSKYLSKTIQSRDTTLDQRWNDNWMQTDKYLIYNSSLASDSAPVLLSPKNVYNHRNYSTNSGKVSPHDNHSVKEDRKIFRCRRNSFPGQTVENRIAGTCMSNRHNSLQHCSPENRIGPEFIEINNLHNRSDAKIDFSQNTGSAFTTNKDNSTVNNNNQAGTARFSKNYSRFTGSQMPKCQNTQSRYGHIFKEKCLTDIHSSNSQYSHQDQENILSTSIKHNSKLTAHKRQVRPFNSFSSYAKRNRFYGSHPNLSFIHGNEFDQNIWTSYDGNIDNELTKGNEDTRDVSKEETVTKDGYLENMKQDRFWKPAFHKKTSSPNTEDVFDPLPIDINQNPEANGDTVKNDEYFPVDIKMFWPKENPTDIIRLLSSTSTGSKISEDSLSPQTHRTPAEILKQKSSCYSDTDSDTTTDDEYFLDCFETAKESAL